MRMIPGYIDEGSPPGEVSLFRLLESCDEEWVVFHSLDLAPFNNDKRTEIDFVIVMPTKGILCVEVKSQKNIDFTGSRWYPESIKRSPFKQSCDASSVLYRRLKSRFSSDGVYFPVVHCCVFPFSDFDISNCTNVLSSELMDRREFDIAQRAGGIARALKLMLERNVEADINIFPIKHMMPADDVERLIEFFSPVQLRKPSRNQELDARRRKMEAVLREQQKPVIKLSEYNRRVFVEGGAGTGKTLIGMEVALTKAQQGKRVAFVCFNNLIGRWVARELEKYQLPNLICGTAHSVMLRMLGISIPENTDSDWWQNSLVLVEEGITDPEVSESCIFDYIVIDEAQDMFARDELWSCMQSFFDGGVQEGSFLILADTQNQTLSLDDSSVLNNRKEVISNSTYWKLDENCRNYRDVGQVALTLSGTSRSEWSGYLRTGGSAGSWSLKFFNDHEKQVDLLKVLLRQLEQEGYAKKNIVLLAFKSLKNSVIRELASEGVVLERAYDLAATEISYSTVSAFKGMEAEVVIVVDIFISPENIDYERKLFYTAITRATEKVYLMCRDSATKYIGDWLRETEK